jgi:hypothetical protein
MASWGAGDRDLLRGERWGGWGSVLGDAGSDGDTGDRDSVTRVGGGGWRSGLGDAGSDGDVPDRDLFAR